MLRDDIKCRCLSCRTFLIWLLTKLRNRRGRLQRERSLARGRSRRIHSNFNGCLQLSFRLPPSSFACKWGLIACKQISSIWGRSSSSVRGDILLRYTRPQGRMVLLGSDNLIGIEFDSQITTPTMKECLPIWHLTPTAAGQDYEVLGMSERLLIVPSPATRLNFYCGLWEPLKHDV